MHFFQQFITIRLCQFKLLESYHELVDLTLFSNTIKFRFLQLVI